jgi:transcriptional regulator with XRE-family HTH domain
MTFGEAIRRIRQSHGISMRAVAADCECSHVYIGEVERGERGPFTSDMLARVYASLKCDAAQRAKLETLRVVALGWLDVSSLSENAVRQLIALRDELRAEEDGA